MEEKSQNLVHQLYKNLGETPLECLLRFKKNNPEFKDVSMTYAGRLDPMAEGLLIVLSGDKVHEKDIFIGLPKTYEFEILWEFETDSLDILGLVSNDDLSLFPTVDHVEKEISNCIGKFEQNYPAYSSQPVIGLSLDGLKVSRPLIQWAREGRISEVKIPSHPVEIFNTEYISRRFENGKNLLEEINSRISKVTGDFRQEKILNDWKKILEQNKERDYAIDLVRLDVSGGFYVRQFVSDLSKKLGVKATTYHILRTKVGDFNLA